MNRTAKILSAGYGLGLCVLAGALFFFDPARVPIYPVCQFHRLTGLDCPGCGGLRALHEVAHGHLLAALRFNIFVVLSLPLWAGLGGWFLWRVARGKPAPAVRLPWLWIYLAAWFAFGVLRDIPGSPLQSLAP